MTPPDPADRPSDTPPDTPATRALTTAGIAFTAVDVTGVRNVEEAAARQGIPTDDLLKTIVVRLGEDDFLFVLVPGSRVIDWPKLRAHLGISRMSLPDADEARDATGYERGTITPFGSTTAWPVVADASIATKERVALGSGRRGTSLQVSAADLLRALDADVVDVTRPG